MGIDYELDCKTEKRAVVYLFLFEMDKKIYGVV